MMLTRKAMSKMRALEARPDGVMEQGEETVIATGTLAGGRE